MAQRLLLMRRADLFRHLGFVRLGDYVVERLGFSYRTAQELMRAEEALERLPHAARALDRGEITPGHVRLLSRVADASTEEFWVGLARRLSVRDLAAAVKAARAARDHARDGPGGETLLGEPCAPDEVPLPAANALDLHDDTPPLQRLELSAPAWIASLWRESVSLVRWLLGVSLPPGACFEVVLVEAANCLPSDEAGIQGMADRPIPYSDRLVSALASALGGHLRSSARSQDPLGTGKGADDVSSDGPPGVFPDASLHETTDGSYRDRADGCRPVDGARQRLHSAARHLDDSHALDARHMDRELRSLVAEGQREEAALAAHLAPVASGRLYLAHGFSSLEAYAADRCDLPARRLYELLALNRTLESLPALRRQFLEGRLTLKQTLLLGPVVAPGTQEAWLERAAAVTLRRLEDEVSFWKHLKETRPEVWGLLGSGPLPDGIALVPGQPPRLREQADLRSSAPSTSLLDGGSAGAGPVGCPISAREFLCALEKDEAATPLPLRIVRIRLRVEPHVERLWRDTLAHLRSALRDDLEEWEALALVLRDFWRVWDNTETRRQRRENPTMDRDGWRCTAPGCRSIGTGRLHEHHIVFRAAGGAEDAPANVTALCSGHHLGLLHAGRMRCSGRAPDRLLWEMGTATGREPFLAYIGEERINTAVDAAVAL